MVDFACRYVGPIYPNRGRSRSHRSAPCCNRFTPHTDLPQRRWQTSTPNRCCRMAFRTTFWSGRGRYGTCTKVSVVVAKLMLNPQDAGMHRLQLFHGLVERPVQQVRERLDIRVLFPDFDGLFGVSALVAGHRFRDADELAALFIACD